MKREDASDPKVESKSTGTPLYSKVMNGMTRL